MSLGGLEEVQPGTAGAVHAGMPHSPPPAPQRHRGNCQEGMPVCLQTLTCLLSVLSSLVCC